jgi:uncharacterized membrane protein
MTILGHPVHPLTVHYPIAFYVLGTGLTLIYLWRNQPQVERFAYWCFLASWVTTVLASVFGLIDQNQLAIDDPRQAAVNNHITAGVSLIITNGLLVYMRFRWQDVLRRYRWQYLTLMALGLVAVFATGWLGAELVYQLGVGVNIRL